MQQATALERRVEAADDGDTDREEHDHDREEGDGASAIAEEEVAGAGNEIGHQHGREGSVAHASIVSPSKCGRSFAKVVSSSSGTRRVCAVTVMKFESPPQRGTMWMW